MAVIWLLYSSHKGMLESRLDNLADILMKIKSHGMFRRLYNVSQQETHYFSKTVN